MTPLEPTPAPVPLTIRRAVTILAVAAVIAVLYFARQVLVPVCLALLLSFAVLPGVRALRRWGFRRGAAVPVAVLSLAVVLGGLVAVLGSQVVHLARSLPTYEATIHERMHVLHHLTLGSLQSLESEVGKLLMSDDAASGSTGSGDLAPTAPVAPNSGRVEASPQAGLSVLTRIVSSAWAPLQATAIVLAVLAFVLLEHESLRDRFIRLAGGADLRATTEAINDAGERLSRYFLSTLSINASVGLSLGIGLFIAGLPNALLWGVTTGLMRFVPYVGVWIMACVVAVFAIAVAPGWSLVVGTIIIFVVVELVASQLVEPMLYGRMTGLSPLAVLVAAIFWSWLWGPVGLVMSTPLTLCMLVAGRHVQALAPLHILLGDTPALTSPQHFYQRALSGDADELIDDAKIWFKRRSFASYCDAVLVPALQLARIDLDLGRISPAQQISVRRVIEEVIESADRSTTTHRRQGRHLEPLSGGTIGERLRRRREGMEQDLHGDGPAAREAVVLCVGLGSNIDDIVTEILTRVLRELDIKAAHLTMREFVALEPASAAGLAGPAMVYIVDSIPSRARAEGPHLVEASRLVAPHGEVVMVALPEPYALRPEAAAPGITVDVTADSIESAAQMAIARFPK